MSAAVAIEREGEALCRTDNEVTCCCRPSHRLSWLPDQQW